MSTDALDSEGLVLKIGDGASPEVFTAIPEIFNVSGPSGTSTTKDATDLSSTSKQKKRGLPDYGQITFSMYYIPTNTYHALLFSLYQSGADKNFQLLHPDSPATEWDITGQVSGFSVSDAVDDLHQASVTIEISDLTEV